MIDIIEKVELNGFPQKIHIKSNNPANPVLLFLHGGPGVANRHAITTANQDLLQHFTIVAWDQRGTAGSYYGCDVKTLTIHQLTEDANALVEYLCKKFHKPKIFVIGGSWGSLLGCSLLRDHPEKIGAFVGFDQFVNGPLNESISYNFTLEEAMKANDQKAVDALKRVGPPVNGCYKGGFDGMMTQRNVMMKYGGYSQNEGKRSYWDAMIKPIFLSGEYSLSDLWGYVKGYKFVLKAMWDEVGGTDFTKTCYQFKAPIFIFDGSLDKNTPAELVEDWFQQIEAPVKELHWFEKSGHNPLGDQPEEFKSLLLEKLLPIAEKEEM